MALERLSSEDAEILRLESTAVRGHTCKVAVVGAAEGVATPELEAIRAHVDRRLPRVPRFREKVMPTPLGIAEPMWVDDAQFDVASHVREAARDLPPDDLPLVVGHVMSERLEHERPLWAIDVAWLDDGRFAVIWRIHHCMADGMTCIKWGDELLWDSEPNPPEDEPREWHPADEPGTPQLLALAGRDRAAGAARAATGAARAVVSPAAWRGAASELVRLPGTLRRELLPGGKSEPSPLDHRLGNLRGVAFASRPLAELKKIEHAVAQKVTVNDTVLAAVAGGLRDWLSGSGSPHDLRVQIPVSMHRRDHHDEGNRDTFLNVDLPISEPDPVARLERIGAETQERKERHDADEMFAFFHSLSHVRPVFQAVERFATRPNEFALSVSNVPGPREERWFMGRPVEELYTIAEPADRHALRVSVVSSAGTMYFSLCADPEAVDGPALREIAEGVDRTIAELLARTGA